MSYILVDNIHAKNPRLIVNSTKGNSWKLLFFFFYLSYLGWEDPLEEGMATPPVFLLGESPWTEGSQRARHN